MHSKSGPRRRHSAELKAKVLAACDEPGASISGVALAHGLNTNLVRKWRTGRGIKLAGLVKPTAVSVAPPRPAPATSPTLGVKPEFVAIEMHASSKATASAVAAQADAIATGTAAADPLIHVELRRGPLHLNVRWPASAARDCTAWLRELTGLLK
jgi:transposase